MKKYFAIMTILLTTSLFAAGVQTVSYVLKTAQDNESVILEGTFISQVDNDEFIFQDKTGKIKVDISRKKTFIEPMIEGLHKLDGAKVKIKAIVDKEMFERSELEAIRIKVLQFAPDEFADNSTTTPLDNNDDF